MRKIPFCRDRTHVPTCQKVTRCQLSYRGRPVVCVCVFSSHPFWTSSSLDVPAGVTQEEGHTGFLIHLPSAVRALIFVAHCFLKDIIFKFFCIQILVVKSKEKHFSDTKYDPI